LDFYCPAEKLAVELDGAGHFKEDGRIYDEVRDKYLNELGIRVIRIENKNVFKNISMVLEYIKDNFKKQVQIDKNNKICSPVIRGAVN